MRGEGGMGKRTTKRQTILGLGTGGLAVVCGLCLCVGLVATFTNQRGKAGTATATSIAEVAGSETQPTSKPTLRPSLPSNSITLPTATLSPTSTFTPTPSSTNTGSPSATPTPSFTNTGSPSATLTPSFTNTGSKTCDHCYYVDSINGSDSNSGTSRNQPWQTIQKAANTMVAGDSTTVLSGDYNERVQITGSGTSGASITYQAEGTVTMKGFTVQADYITIVGFDISNTDDNWKEGWGIFVEGSYCDIEGNYVHYATRGGINIWARPGNETKTNHCTVRNNRLYRNAMAGIEVYGQDNLIEGNEIWGTIQYHPQWINPPSYVDADGMRFFGAGHVIRKNYIHDISYLDPENVNPHIDCFQTWNDANQPAGHDIIFEQNVCRNLHVQPANENAQGFMLEGASNLIIRNNILWVFRGINVVGGQNLTIVNNTFASDLSFPLSSGPPGVGLSQTQNAVVKNNIFYDFLAPSVWVADSVSAQGLDVGYNLIYRSDGRTPSGSPYPHDLWQINPMFADPASGDFHLQSCSPAVDAGVTLANITDDFAGNPRPQGVSYDIGAYELPVSCKTALPADARTNDMMGSYGRLPIPARRRPALPVSFRSPHGSVQTSGWPSPTQLELTTAQRLYRTCRRP